MQIIGAPVLKRFNIYIWQYRRKERMLFYYGPLSGDYPGFIHGNLFCTMIKAIGNGENRGEGNFCPSFKGTNMSNWKRARALDSKELGTEWFKNDINICQPRIQMVQIWEAAWHPFASSHGKNTYCFSTNIVHIFYIDMYTYTGLVVFICTYNVCLDFTWMRERHYMFVHICIHEHDVLCVCCMRSLLCNPAF